MSQLETQISKAPLFHPVENSLENVRVISLPCFVDEGALIPMEGLREIPFNIARIFFVHSVPAGSVRGNHAHRTCQQGLIALSGACEVVCDDGTSSKVFVLERPNQCLLVPPGIWAKEKYLSMETRLLVLSDQGYDPQEYIHDYGEFLTLRGISRSS